MIDKWDRRFLQLAKHISTWSKDPSTQTGAVIVNEDRIVVALGFNGLARRVIDYPERYNNRELKLKTIIHCEMNAILCSPVSVQGCTLYTWPFASCSHCAGMVVQAGISRAVAPICTKEEGHWMHESINMTRDIFAEAGIALIFVNGEDLGRTA